MTDTDAAASLGSGDVAVLGTPRLVACWSLRRSPLPYGARPGQPTVGTAVRVEHLRAIPPGGWVEVRADPPSGTTGGRLAFVVHAVDGSGAVVVTHRYAEVFR